MNKVIRDRYPVSRLPEDLRDEVGNVTSVRVTLEPTAPPESSLTDILERARRLRAEGKIKPVTTEDAVARVRALRDEWDS
jgi:hypothetical protein